MPAMSLRPLLWALGYVTIYATLAVADDPECNGHGHKNGTACICDVPSPGLGQIGYTGEDCTIRVYGANLDGSDMTQDCANPDCSKLPSFGWVCFYSPLAWDVPDSPWNYLTIQLNRTSEDQTGDPDLYGSFFNSSQPEFPGNLTYKYQFRETSSSSHKSVVKSVKKADYPDATYDGVYLCVKAYGPDEISFTLRATLSKCPADFTKTGELMECSTPVSSAAKRHTGCTAEGLCICNPPYEKPPIDTYEGIGFDDCSAKTEEVPDKEFAASGTFVTEHQDIEAQAWNFYKFNVTDEDYQVIVNVAGETSEDDECGLKPGKSSSYSDFGAYMKFGQPPGRKYTQYDLRPRWKYATEDSDLELSLEPETRGYQRGEWWLGINGEDMGKCKYTLTISKYDCLLNCTGQGQCHHLANGTHTCLCNEGFFGETCADHAEPLAYDNPLQVEEKSFEYQYYDLPSVTPAMLTHSVEVRFAISHSSSDWGIWANAKPELLLLKGDAASYPSTGNYTFKVVLEKQNQTYSLDLCPSQLKQGVWRAAVYNPMRIYKVGYNFNVTKHGICLNNCTGHGSCTDEGECQCQGNWAGGDCSVDTSVGTCKQGSRLPSKRPEQKGTCWQECQCDASGECSYQEDCAAFTCDSNDFRQKGHEAECVEDKCKQDEWETTSVHTCLRECSCPSDGSSCTLKSECKKENFACKEGYKRFSSGEASCYLVGCQEGALKANSAVSVANGKAYGICSCTGPERQDAPHCRVEESDPEQLSIICKDGYSLEEAKSQSSSGVWLGGRCVRSKRGTPAWGVVLWTFLGLLIGGAASMAGLYFYEHKLRAPQGSNSMYHELSMDTGF